MLFLFFFVLLLLYCTGADEGRTGGRGKSILRHRDSQIKDLAMHPRSHSEDLIVSLLEKLTGEKFPTVNPEWLVWQGKTLELDGYNRKMGLALEFSGPLHTKFFAKQESYQQYFARIVKDVVKRRLCKKHGVYLIVVDTSLPRPLWNDYLKSRLFDGGFITEKPARYIDKQTVKPYRNEAVEKELGLQYEYAQAKGL
jgi:hypothetical protein